MEEEKTEYNESEGLYYERVFCPSHIEVHVHKREGDKKRSWEEARAGDLKLVLTDKNGQKLEVEGTASVKT